VENFRSILRQLFFNMKLGTAAVTANEKQGNSKSTTSELLH
jgi:hypothetical protein